MPCYLKICSQLLQSTFLTFQHWWRRNSIHWHNTRQPQILCSLYYHYSTTYSNVSWYYTSRWTKTAAYVTNFTAIGKVTKLTNWWDTLCELSQKFGNHLEGNKTWLIVEGNQEHAIKTFQETNIKITAGSQRFLD